LLIRLIAVGKRQPDWINRGYQEYARRLQGSCRLELTEVSPGQRSRGASPTKARALEGERLLRAIPAHSHVVVLAVDGEAWSTPKLASKLTQWTKQGLIICLLIGGADGLDIDVLKRADEHWSLSSLTFPHGLVRPVVAEALYRAWSLTQGHPYHRG